MSDVCFQLKRLQQGRNTKNTETLISYMTFLTEMHWYT